MLTLMLTPLLLIPLALGAIHFGVTKNAAFAEALFLSSGKGIINIGSGAHRTQWAREVAENPNTLVNIDIIFDSTPSFLQLDLESSPLPFSDKQFGCAFASHVLEHLDNWEFALAEMVRVADYIVLVLPSPIYGSGRFCSEHKQFFSTDDINAIAQQYPNVKVFC